MTKKPRQTASNRLAGTEAEAGRPRTSARSKASHESERQFHEMFDQRVRITPSHHHPNGRAGGTSTRNSSEMLGYSRDESGRPAYRTLPILTITAMARIPEEAMQRRPAQRDLEREKVPAQGTDYIWRGGRCPRAATKGQAPVPRRGGRGHSRAQSAGAAGSATICNRLR